MSADRYVPLAEVRQIISKESKRRELSAEQRIVLEHAQKFSSLSLDDINKLLKELHDLGFISEQNRIKIADLLPVTPDDARLIFSKERTFPDKKQIEQIIGIVQKYV